MNYVSEDIINEKIFTHGEGYFPIKIYKIEKRELTKKLPERLSPKEGMYTVVIGEPIRARRGDLDHTLMTNDFESMILRKSKKSFAVHWFGNRTKKEHQTEMIAAGKLIDQGQCYLEIKKGRPYLYSNFKGMKILKEDDVIESRMHKLDSFSRIINIIGIQRYSIATNPFAYLLDVLINVISSLTFEELDDEYLMKGKLRTLTMNKK